MTRDIADTPTSGRDLLTSGSVPEYPEPFILETVDRPDADRGMAAPLSRGCVRRAPGSSDRLMYMAHPAPTDIPAGAHFVQRLQPGAAEESHIPMPLVRPTRKIAPLVGVMALVSIHTGVGDSERTSI